MINIRPVIEQRIRSQVPGFLEVASSASLQTVQQARMSDRGCYVVPERITAAASEVRNMPIAQKLGIQLAIIIVVKNVRDTRGVDASDVCADLQASVQAALLGWRNNNTITPIEYVGGQLLSYANGFYIWKDSYKTTTLIKAAQ